MASNGYASSLFQRAANLRFYCITQVVSRQRPNLRLAVLGSPNPKPRDAFGETSFELLGNRFNDDEALGGNATLTSVLVPRTNRHLSSCFQVSVSQDDKGVRTSEFQNALLERAAARPAAPPTLLPVLSLPVSVTALMRLS
jgi:hypothetical protein